MPNYAIHNGERVLNVIVADTREIAEQVTERDAIESVDGEPWIDWQLIDGAWVAPVDDIVDEDGFVLVPTPQDGA